MPLELPVGFFELTFLWQSQGDPAMKTYNLAGRDTAGGDTSADLGAAAGFMVADWATEFASTAAAFHTGWTWRGVEARLNTSDAGEQVMVLPFNIGGTAAGQPVHSNSCLLVKKLSALGGRKHRGRMFLPGFGLNEANVSVDGVIDPAIVANNQTAWDNFIGSPTIGGWTPVLLHTDPLDTPDDIVAFVVENQLATQRRRMRHG